MDMQTIGQKVRQARKMKGITQEQLANLVGLSTMSIRRYESGERIITDEILERIADALGIQPWEFDKKSYDVAKLMTTNAKYSALVQSIIDYDDIPPKLKNFIVNNSPEDVSAYLINFGRQLHAIEEPGDSHLSNAVIKLLELFDRLNPDGQQKAVERVEELTEIPHYQAGKASQEAAEPAPTPPEGKDTTTPEPLPESP